MSLILVRAALETALAAMTPAVATAWENVPFTPPAASVPYQAAFLIPAEPDNAEYGAAHTEQAIFQVSLFYPLQVGPAAAAARAEMLRTLFKRGASFTSSGVTVKVTRTPEVSQGTVDGDRWFLPVKVRISAYIAS